MEKEWNEFINYDVGEFKKKTEGRYFVLSWTPVKSNYNPLRCQVRYRRWKPGDVYDVPIPVANVIVTKPMGVETPVVTRREEQVGVADTVRPEPAGMGLGVVVIAVIIAIGYLLLGRRK